MSALAAPTVSPRADVPLTTRSQAARAFIRLRTRITTNIVRGMLTGSRLRLTMTGHLLSAISLGRAVRPLS